MRNSSINILVVQVAGIGDAVMASTIPAKLRAEQPGAKVTWVCTRAAAPLVALFDGVHETIAVDAPALFRGNPVARVRAILGVWRKILARGFDRVILVHVDRRYRLLVLPLVRVPKVSLSRSPQQDVIPIPGRYFGDEIARLVEGTAHVGPLERRYEIANLRPKLKAVPKPEAARRRVVLVPGGTRNALRESVLRRWPVEHYAALAAILVQAGHQVTLVGDDHDAWVRPSFEGIDVHDQIGALSIVETAELMAGSDVVVSHDTGPMHLARVVRAPLIALFGPTDPSQFISRDETVTVIWGGAELACRPCYDGREFATCSANICLSRITPAVVLRHVEARLAAQGLSTAAG